MSVGLEVPAPLPCALRPNWAVRARGVTQFKLRSRSPFDSSAFKPPTCSEPRVEYRKSKVRLYYVDSSGPMREPESWAHAQ
jgi:hypothetical protein